MDRDEIIIGMGGLQGLSQEIGMIKRIYIRPEQRGNGYGRNILHHLINKGEELDFSVLRLDTGKFMTAAIYLYRSAGFSDIEAYPETEVPLEGHPYWLFMEKIL